MPGGGAGQGRARREGGGRPDEQEAAALDTEPHDDPEDEEEGLTFERLSRRQQQALRDGMTVLFETYLLDLMEFQDPAHFSFEESALSAIIPPQYHSLCDLGFARRMLVCFISAMERVRNSESPRCVAEEMAVKAIFDFTLDMVGDQGERDGETAEETAAGLEDYMDNVLLEDADFEFLWEPRFDGVEHAVPELGMANLAFSSWFKAFREARPVNPYLEEE